MKKLSAIVIFSCITAALPVSYSVADEASDEPAAETESAETASPRVRRTQTLREVVYEKLEDARDAADGGDFDGALKTLERLESRKRNSYERAMTHNMYAYVYSAKEDYAAAVDAYSQVLEIRNAPDNLKQSTRYTMSKLYMVQERYDESLAMLSEWMEHSDKITADAWFLRSQIQYQRQAFDHSLNAVETAISMRRESGRKVSENWYLLQRAVLFQQKDYPGLAENLEALVAEHPKSEYWVQLAAVYNELGFADKELATLETAYEQKLLTKERELVNFAQALLGQQIPYKAAHVLEIGMNTGTIGRSARNLSLLGDAWMLAHEYEQAIIAMTAAAAESRKGADYFKLAQIHTERQEWDKAFDFSQKALDAGDLKAPYQAMIIKGLAQFNMDRLKDAARTFSMASQFPEAEKVANQWHDYIESEQQRRAYIADAGV